MIRCFAGPSQHSHSGHWPLGSKEVVAVRNKEFENEKSLGLLFSKIERSHSEVPIAMLVLN